MKESQDWADQVEEESKECRDRTEEVEETQEYSEGDTFLEETKEETYKQRKKMCKDLMEEMRSPSDSLVRLGGQGQDRALL